MPFTFLYIRAIFVFFETIFVRFVTLTRKRNKKKNLFLPKMKQKENTKRKDNVTRQAQELSRLKRQ